jgi:hypothetical protein
VPSAESGVLSWGGRGCNYQFDDEQGPSDLREPVRGGGVGFGPRNARGASGAGSLKPEARIAGGLKRQDPEVHLCCDIRSG